LGAFKAEGETPGGETERRTKKMDDLKNGKTRLKPKPKKKNNRTIGPRKKGTGQVGGLRTSKKNS